MLNTLGMAIVAVIVAHILLVWLGANPANPAATLVRELAGYFDLGLSNLFLLDDPEWSVGVNYGVAALIWVAITGLAVRLVRRVG